MPPGSGPHNLGVSFQLQGQDDHLSKHYHTIQDSSVDFGPERGAIKGAYATATTPVDSVSGKGIMPPHPNPSSFSHSTHSSSPKPIDIINLHADIGLLHTNPLSAKGACAVVRNAMYCTRSQRLCSMLSTLSAICSACPPRSMLAVSVPNVVVHTVTVTERASELGSTVDSTVAYSCVRYCGTYVRYSCCTLRIYCSVRGVSWVPSECEQPARSIVRKLLDGGERVVG